MPVMIPSFFKCLGAVLSLYSILSEWLFPYPVAHLLIRFSSSSLVSPRVCHAVSQTWPSICPHLILTHSCALLLRRQPCTRAARRTLPRLIFRHLLVCIGAWSPPPSLLVSVSCPSPVVMMPAAIMLVTVLSPVVVVASFGPILLSGIGVGLR